MTNTEQNFQYMGSSATFYSSFPVGGNHRLTSGLQLPRKHTQAEGDQWNLEVPSMLVLWTFG